MAVLTPYSLTEINIWVKNNCFLLVKELLLKKPITVSKKLILDANISYVKPLEMQMQICHGI